MEQTETVITCLSAKHRLGDDQYPTTSREVFI
jgi:hypothetical protein